MLQNCKSVAGGAHGKLATAHLSYRFPILKLPPPPCAVLLVLLMVRNSNKLCKLRLVMNIQPFMVSWTLAPSKMGLVLGPPKPSTKGDLYKQQDQPFLSSPRSLYFVAAFQRLDKFMYPTRFSGSHYWRVQFLLSIFCVSWVVVFLSNQNRIETFWERGTTKNKKRFHPKLHGYLAGGSATHLKNMLVKLDHCPKFLGF